MTIIITKQNESFFKGILKKELNVVDETTNTLHVKVTTKQFNRLYQRVVELGHNPYAAMAW